MRKRAWSLLLLAAVALAALRGQSAVVATVRPMDRATAAAAGFVECPWDAPEAPPEPPLALVALEARMSDNLRAAAASWVHSGVLQEAGERIVFLQQLKDEDCALAARGWRVVGHRSNAGIAAALAYAVRLARAPAVLFLECDWHAAGEAPRETVRAARDMVVGGQVVMAALRREEPYGPFVFGRDCAHEDVLHAALMGGNARCRAQFDGPRRFQTATSALKECPDKVTEAYPSRLPRCAPAPGFVCFKSTLGHWSNNPSVFDRRWWLDNVLPHLPDCALDDPECLRRGVERNWQLQCHLRSLGAPWAAAVPGAFLHREVQFVQPLPVLGRAPFRVSSTDEQDFGSHGMPDLIPGLRFFAISSDDWGRAADNEYPVLPDLSFREKLGMPKGAEGGPLWRAGAESAADVLALAELLAELNEGVEDPNRRLVMSANVVVAPGEDPPPLERPPYSREGLREAMHAAFERGLVHPEYHGRAHVDAAGWRALVDGGDQRALRCAKHGVVCGSELGNEYGGRSREDLAAWIREGLEAFRAEWGYWPATTVPPNNAGTCALGGVLRELGVFAVDARRARDFPRSPLRQAGSCPVFARDGLQAMERSDALDVYLWDRLPPHDDGVRAAVDERVLAPGDVFTLLSVHSQNFISAGNHRPLREALRRVVRAALAHLQQSPGAVFVTPGEMHQIRLRGFSAEVWADGRMEVRCFRPAGCRVACSPDGSGAVLEVGPGGREWCPL